MASYAVYPLSDSFSVQRCLTWAPPAPPPLMPAPPSRSYMQSRPASAPLIQRIHAQQAIDRKSAILLPTETTITKKAPYAPRLIDSKFQSHFHTAGPVPIGGASMNVSGLHRPQRQYSPISDPHLHDFYVRKFMSMEQLLPSKRRDAVDGDTDRKKKSKKDAKKLATYRVAVKTGDKKNSGTNAKVYLTIIGTKGKLPKRHLAKKTAPNSKRQEFEFKKNSTHVFKFDGLNIGNIESIIIQHDGVTEEESWYLDQVEIHKKSLGTGQEKSWIFACHNWLSLYEGDCQVRRELFVQHSSNTEYEVVAVTGNVKGAGTDANVFVTLFGKTGQTPKLQLKASNCDNMFERNQSDVFVLKTKCCGPLDKIRIQHDNTGFAPGWFLDRVVVTDLKNPRWKFYFPCGQWLAKDEGDGLICRDLVGSQDPLGVRKVSKYKITVFTGNKRGAGTDANVFVTLFGELGDSGERKLDTKRKNNFESGMTDEFTIESASLGKLQRLRISHDNSGPSPGWFLDKVIVDDVTSNRVYEFPCQRWLAKDEDDGQISRDLVCGRGGDAAVPYSMHVKTGDVPNAGTSAGVYTVLYGGKDGNRSSGKILLSNGKFERGRTDIFNFDVAEMLSPLSRIDIGHDNKGPGPGWFLDEVIVRCMSAGIEQTFKCGKWLALDEGDRTIERTLYESSRKKKEKMDTWQVSVFTADERSAGTDANVLLVIYGKNADGTSIKSDEVRLENKGDNFEVGQVDKFAIETIDVGKPYKIRVAHDNSGSLPGWKLDRIELENLSTKKHYTFHCNRWLAKDEDDGSIVREMPAEGDDIKRPQPLVKYKVKVHTGKKLGAGTDANVFLNIFGNQGDTGERPLSKSSSNKNKFEKGNVDEFTIEAVTLKKLSKIRIGHDGSKAGSGWFLDKVVVQSEDDPSAATVFECNRWLDVKEDDGLIVREITAGGSQMLATTSYHLSVKTGTVRGAGTDANVFVKIFGTKGDTGTLKLASAENTKNKFEAGRTDDFRLEATDIGQLKKLRIGHDGTGAGAGWFLDEVIVDIPSKGEKYTFACHRWLDKNENDGQIEIEMEPTSVEKGAMRIPYEITVWTGDKRGAGTDANVFIQMYGEGGKTEEYQLRNRTDNFEQGHVDKFKIEAADVGPLLKVRVGHDGKGAFAGWFLDKLLIQRHPTKSSKRRHKRRHSADHKGSRHKEHKESDRHSSISRRHSEMESDRHSSISRRHSEMESDRHSSISRRHSEMESDRHSSISRRHSEMESDRHSSISRRHSEMESDRRSSISRKQLKEESDSDGGMSIRSHRKKYNGEEARDVRRPSSASASKRSARRMSHSSESDRDRDSPRRAQKSTRHRLSDDDDDDKMSRTSSRSASKRSQKPGDKLSRRRSRSRSSDSDSDVKSSVLRRKSSLVRDDSDAESRSVRLRDATRRGSRDDSRSDKKSTTKSRAEKYDDSDVDRKSTRRSEDKRRSSVSGRRGKQDDSDSDHRTRHSRDGLRRKRENDDDDHGKRKLTDEEHDEGVEEYWFVCNKWFDKNEGDGKIIRELLPTTEDGQPLDVGLSEVEYIVKVYTGDKFGAGTDANIFVNITGEFGDTGERQLSESNNVNKFERKQEDIFKVSAVELGKLKKLKIRHDNKGGGAAWYLDRVEVEDPKNKKSYLFVCQHWLATDKDDGQISRELVPHDSQRKGSMKDVALEDKALKTTYHVNVYTGDKFGAGTDANVFITLFGEIDDTGKVFLKASKNNKNKFERNQMDEFVIEAVDIGELKKIRIGHDNAGGGGAWYLDRVEIDCPHLGRKWVFAHSRWIAKDQDDGKLERELFPQEMATEEYNPCVPYEITTYTSDISGAGSSADVYIVLYGRDTCTSQKSLCPNKNDRKKNFDRAKEAKFVIELEDIPGEIEKIRIGHDGKGFGSGWHLDRVEIRRLKVSGKGSETYVFPCKRWLAKDEDDCAIERELVADKVIDETLRKDGTSSKRELQRRNTLTAKKYIVNVVTGDVKNAGTDANVFLTIFGQNGDTGERQLTKSETHSNKFERNQTDKFVIEAVDLGEVHKIKIRHDDSNFSSDWFLARVEVYDPDVAEPFMFHCERWLAKKKDDGKLERTIYAKGYRGDMNSSSTLHSKGMSSMASMDSMQSSEPFGKSPRVARRHLAMEDIPEGPTIPYTVKVTTGREKKMGTKSNVFIKMIGTKKRHTGKQFLELTSQKGFIPGSVETFSLECVDVGEVQQIELGHDGVTEESGWFVQEVEVDMPTKGKHYFFKCDSWLAKDKEDGLTCRVFGLDEGDASVVNYKPMIPYEVTFFTGDVAESGTDSQVFIKVFGVKGSSSDIVIPKMSERFERSRVDLIKLELEDIAPLRILRVGLDGKGSRPNWYLEKVEIRNMSTGDLAIFKVNAWLSKTKDDQKLVRDIPATVKGKEVVKQTTYKVSVQTSNVNGAGTDAGVYVTMFGENGDSGEIRLKNSETNKKPFENNQLDIFTLPNILDLGLLFKIRIWHDNKGFGAAWHLGHVEVEDMATGAKYMFPCNRWLSKSEDDKQICRELTCSNLPSPKVKSKITYQIEVITSDVPDAGTAHNVWLKLVGDLKESDDFLIENTARRKILKRGQTDSEKMVSRNLGNLTKCYVGLVNNYDTATSSKDSEWHCEGVIVTNVDTGDRYVFVCDDWIKVQSSVTKRNAKLLELQSVEESHLSAVKSLANVKYDIAVYTGNESGSGTNANVSLTIYGTNGDTGKRALTQKFRDLFERGQKDTFQIEAVDLGDLKKIKVEHDNAGFRPGWLLDRVEITNTTSGHTWTFACNAWLDKSKGDGQIARELFPRK